MRKRTWKRGWKKEFRGKAGVGDRLGTLFESRRGYDGVKHFNNCV